MVGAENPIIPVIRDQAPVLERIRNRNGKAREGGNVAANLGELVGKIVKTDSDEELNQTKKEFDESFTSSLADELGVSEDDIDSSFVDDLGEQLISTEENNVLRQGTLEDFGISTGSEEAESEQPRETEETDNEGEADSSGEEAELFRSE